MGLKWLKSGERGERGIMVIPLNGRWSVLQAYSSHPDKESASRIAMDLALRYGGDVTWIGSNGEIEGYMGHAIE